MNSYSSATKTHRVYLDSRFARNRIDRDTKRIKTAVTNPLTFDFGYPFHNIIGIAVSDVSLDVRIPKFRPDERQLEWLLEPSPGQIAYETVSIPPVGTGENPDSRVDEGVNMATTAEGVISGLNLLPTTQNGIKFKSVKDNQYALYEPTFSQSPSVAVPVALVDNKASRRLGYYKFPFSSTVTTSGVTTGAENVGKTYRHTKFVSNTRDSEPDTTHELRIPDLYLSCDWNVNAYINQQQRNIIYKAIFNDAQEAPDGDKRVPFYVDRQRTVAPLELSAPHASKNKITLRWMYADGRLAEIRSEWSLTLDIITHNPS